MTSVFLSSRDNNIITSNNFRLGLVSFLPLSLSLAKINLDENSGRILYIFAHSGTKALHLLIHLLIISRKYTHKLSTAVYKLVCRRKNVFYSMRWWCKSQCRIVFNAIEPASRSQFV